MSGADLLWVLGTPLWEGLQQRGKSRPCNVRTSNRSMEAITDFKVQWPSNLGVDFCTSSLGQLVSPCSTLVHHSLDAVPHGGCGPWVSPSHEGETPAQLQRWFFQLLLVPLLLSPFSPLLPLRCRLTNFHQDQADLIEIMTREKRK